MEIELTGYGTASCVYGESSSKAPVLSLARLLCKMGHSRSTVVHVKRNGTPVFVPTTLGWFADRVVTETDRVSAKFSEYRVMPEGLHSAGN